MSTPSAELEIGLIGLGVMGRNLALNIAEHGFSIAVHNRSPGPMQRWLADAAQVAAAATFGAATPAELVAALRRPRKVVVMVPAGAATDAVIAQLRELLEPGDLIVDGGNSHPRDTERRGRELEAAGLEFVGMGVSGGEEGARRGPSLMPGGSAEAWAALAPLLRAIAAQVDDGPCVTHVGPGSAGHFVKMVHNGIEYGDMQLIAEVYDVMSGTLGMTPAEMAGVFRRWNDGPLESFLIEITGSILATDDPETGRPIVDVIVDRAGQKGTGRWTAEAALEHGVAAPTIRAAVEARALSAGLDGRRRASALLRGPDATFRGDRDELLAALHDALYAAKICSYAQGLDLMRTAGHANGWELELGHIARIWKGGCIIRARFLEEIRSAYERAPDLANLMLDESFRGFLHAAAPSWRRVVATAVEHGVPVLALAGSLSYFDSYRRARLPQNLTQAQRDYFGAHTFERVDRPAGEHFHHAWS